LAVREAKHERLTHSARCDEQCFSKKLKDVTKLVSDAKITNTEGVFWEQALRVSARSSQQRRRSPAR
jgi:hypothetical protein